MRHLLKTLTIKKVAVFLVVILVITGVVAFLSKPSGRPGQQISQEAEPTSIPGIPDLRFSPNYMVTKVDKDYEVDVTYKAITLSQSSIFVAYDFEINYPADLLENVSFVPSPGYEVVDKNVQSEGKIRVFAFDTDNKIATLYGGRYNYNLEFLGKLKFRTKNTTQGAQLTFSNASFGILTSGGATFRNPSLYKLNLVIKDELPDANTVPVDPLFDSRAFGPEETAFGILFFDDNNRDGIRNPMEIFNDDNKNGICDNNEDFSDGNQNGKCDDREEPIYKGPAITVNALGPFLAGQTRFSETVNTNDLGVAVFVDPKNTANQTTYTLTMSPPEGFSFVRNSEPISNTTIATVSRGRPEIFPIGVAPLQKIQGVVYEDKNNNGKFDENEDTALSNVSIKVQQTSPGTGPLSTITTTSDGIYSFQLPNYTAQTRTYKVSIVPPQGLKPSGSNVFMADGMAYKNVNVFRDSKYTADFSFVEIETTPTITPPNSTVTPTLPGGVTTTPTTSVTEPPTATPKPPTATPKPPTATPTNTASPTPSINLSPPVGGASLFVNVTLPGIGTAKPDYNREPIRKTREAQIQLIGQAGSTPINAEGALTFNGNGFSGNIRANNVPPGNYQVKVRLDNTLYKIIPGIYTLNDDATVTTQTVALVPGDINRDRILDLLDYNIVLACVQAKPTCTATQRALVDFNSDGKIGNPDYNLFLNQLEERVGD